MKKVLSFIIFCITFLILTGCAGLNYSYCLYVASGSIYTKGTQDVYVAFNDKIDDSSNFTEDIGVDDINLFGILASKKVLAVSYESPTSIKIEITGECPSTFSASTGIEVNARAISSGVTCRATIKEVAKPCAYTLETYSVSNLGSKSGSFTSILTMPVGNFLEEGFSTGITYNGSTDNVSYVYKDGKLTLTVNLYYYTDDAPLPTVHFSEATNDLGCAFDIKIGRQINS